MTVPDRDWQAQLEALRQAGAERLDPLRLHFLQALARRARAQPDSVRRLLDARLAQASAQLQQRLAQAPPVPQPDSVAAARPVSPLAELVRELAQAAEATSDSTVPGAGPTLRSRPELRSVRRFRKTWSALSAERQLSQARAQAPQNAGPINSHMLVLRALDLMRATSPDYLMRFMSHVETLLLLDPGEPARPVPPRKALASEAGNTSKAGRARKRPG